MCIRDRYGTIESQLEYEYDENRIKEERIYNGEELDVTLRFLYNSEGKEVERREYNNQGKLNQIESNHYDLNGNLIERNTKDFFEEFEVKDIFVFNKKNVMINSKSFSNGTLIFENVCEYDDLNRIKKEHVHEKYIDGSYLSVYCILHEYID